MSEIQIDKETTDKVEAIKQLGAKKEEYYLKIVFLEAEIAKFKSKIEEIDTQINNLIGLNKTPNPIPSPTNNRYQIPQKGIVIEIAEVMSEEVPMSRQEIFEALKQKGLDVNEHSVRSYLTNLQCFECIKKSDPRYDKKGWICHKGMIKHT